MTSSRILITGGSSYLGQHLVPLALAEAAGITALLYTFYSHDPLALPQGRRLDVRERAEVFALVDSFQPDVIIHTAGSNRPVETMDEVIRLGATHIAEAAAAVGARLIHLSTDVIFDGRHAPYREEDPPNPIHAYGRAKAAAEAIIGDYSDHVIVRTSLIYGLARIDRGTGWVQEALAAGRPVTLFTDQMRNPVWAPALSQACFELASLTYTGVLHVAGEQRLSRAEFGVKMLDWWGITQREGLHFGPSDPERWPQDCTLALDRARSVLQTPLPGVDSVLASAHRERQNQDPVHQDPVF